MRSRAAATIEAVDAAMSTYAFGEVTRLLYDAIWSEYCDWGVELAKVRLGDDDRSADEREATWWTLVEVLDTYLRALHPVMPFVTEALWAGIPHRASDPDLLIVARWPAPAGRDLAIEGEVEAVLDLIRGIRNARSEARLEPAAWLETEIVVPVALGSTFESLRPAVERLARARPIERRLTREALTTRDGTLTVIAGDLEAVVHPPTTVVDPAAIALERARLERDLAEASEWLVAARARLTDDRFVTKAPAAIVEQARAREAELVDQVERLRARLG